MCLAVLLQVSLALPSLLTKTSRNNDWKQAEFLDEKTAVVSLKEVLMISPVPPLPKHSRSCLTNESSCDSHIGCVLIQKQDDGTNRPTWLLVSDTQQHGKEVCHIADGVRGSFTVYHAFESGIGRNLIHVTDEF